MIIGLLNQPRRCCCTKGIPKQSFQVFCQTNVLKKWKIFWLIYRKICEMGFLLKLLVWVLDLSKIWFGPRFIPVNFTKYFRKAFQIKPPDAYRKINDSLLFHTGAHEFPRKTKSLVKSIIFQSHSEEYLWKKLQRSAHFSKFYLEVS